MLEYEIQQIAIVGADVVAMAGGCGHPPLHRGQILVFTKKK
jgi:hypothetical protein